MKRPRRNFLQLAVGAAAVPAIPQFAWAQTYPTRPVRIVVATGAGGAPDILARLIGQWLFERLGQQFVVENRPGGGNNIGTEAVVRAAPDGYTLLLVDPTASINATLYEKRSYNFIRDIAPVAGIVRLPFVMVVSPSFPAKTVPEFIAFAKANPGKINMASPGIATPGHVAGELFKMMTGVDMVHVPYRGGAPALTDLIGGAVQVFFPSTSLAIEQIGAGKLRPLAVTTAIRWEGLRDTPTVGEFVPGYEASIVLGIGVPQRTPVEIIDKLNREITDSEAKAGCPRDPGVLENQVVGKEVNKAMQESAEGPLRAPSATETVRDASVHRDLDRVVCARHLIHDWQCSYGELGRSQNVYGSKADIVTSVQDVRFTPHGAGYSF